MKPENWLPVGWLPVYDPARSKRPGTGYEGHPARSVRLFHDCFKHLLQNWNERTKNSQVIPYGDDICRQTRFFLGGLLGDQQVHLHTCNTYYAYLTYLTYFTYFLYSGGRSIHV